MKELKEIRKEVIVDFRLEFPNSYRENRHGTKIIKVKIYASAVANWDNGTEQSWGVKLKVPKRPGAEISWEFPENCPEFLRNLTIDSCDYKSLYKLLQSMKRER